MNIHQFEERKREHIQLALDTANQASGHSGLEQVHLYHEALPDLDFEEVTLDSVSLGKKTSTPFYIAAMTAGHADAPRLNMMLAKAAALRGWAMGVGSQRRELENPASPTIDGWKQLRDEFPNLMLYGNLGVSQLIHATTKQVQALVESMNASGLMIHLNALQEVMQPEGTPQFKGALSALRRLSAELSVPVLLKETGCGFSEKTLKRVADTGIAGVDISGLGGTHWGRIEGARASEASIQREAAKTFANWGETTVNSVIAAKKSLPTKIEIWASGGVRTGLDAAKLIALGAHQVGFAKPALEAALQGEAELQQWMATREYELKVALFCTGSKNPNALRTQENLWKISGN
jgi:isopentenyl-diphosphate delta-isomerase